jgi:HEPN domain-containing protein
MTIEEHIKYWVDSAEYDMDSAFDIFKTKRYAWSLYIGHLALEKILKAIYVKSSVNKVPPKIHNLRKLAELSDLRLNDEQLLFLDFVNNFQLEARYAEFKNELYKLATESFTLDNLNKIKEQYLWFKSLIS